MKANTSKRYFSSQPNTDHDDDDIINLVCDNSDQENPDLDPTDIAEFLQGSLPPEITASADEDVYDDPLQDNFGLKKSTGDDAEESDQDIHHDDNIVSDANRIVDMRAGQDRIEEIFDPKWGPKRRRKDYLESFKISKPIREEEEELDYENLYCESCEKYFRNESEKIAHESSKAHRDQIGEDSQQYQVNSNHNSRYYKDTSVEAEKKSKETLIQEGEVHKSKFVASEFSKKESNKSEKPKPKRVKEMPVVPEVEVDPRIAKMINEEGPKLRLDEVPASFKTWANKSIAAALRKEKMNKDPYLVAYVRKEVAYELIRNKLSCNLYRVNWSRVSFASGDVVKPKKLLNKTLTMNEVRNMDARASSAQQSFL